MKWFFNLLGIAAAGAIGYMVEPELRSQLTGTPPVEKTDGKAPDKGPQIDFASLTSAQLPDRVVVKTDVKVSDNASGVTMTLPSGSRVKLVRIDGSNAVVSPGEGPYLGSVAISDTDLAHQLATSPPPAAVEKPKTPEAAAPVFGTPNPPTPPVPPAPVTPPTGDSEEPAKAPESPPAIEPAPLPLPEPSPAPTVTDTSSPAPEESAGGQEVVKAMQDSIKSGQIKEFTYDQVFEWRVGAEETVDGEVFKTGTAAFKGETTHFGVRTMQAKALVKGDKVQRWIWPKSGLEIK